MADMEDKGRLSEEKKVEFRKSDYLDIVFDRVPEGLAIIEAKEQRVLLVSKYAAHIIEREREELEDVTQNELIARWDIYKSDGVTRPRVEEFPIFRSIVKKEFIENEEWVLRKPSGARVSVLINACHVEDESGKVAGAVASWVDISDRKATEEKLRSLNQELNEALRKVRVLSGMLKVCASCKRVQNDRGNWESIEKYISERSEAEFSHSICPDCAEKLYGKNNQ